VIQGPAGIGKTALVQRFLEGAGHACVMRTSGEEVEAKLPFGVLAQLAIASPVSPPPGAISTVVDGSKGLPDPLVAGAALLDLLGYVQHQTGEVVVVVIDDTHWADRPSLHALTFALRRLRVQRVAALVLVRDVADPRLPEGLRRLLVGDHTLRLTLDGLRADELRILSGQLGVQALSLRAAERLRAHTQGNPLHARALLEQLSLGVLEDPDAPLPAPRSFAMLVLARLGRCPSQTQELVAAASVLGHSCPLHQTARLAGIDDPLPALEQAIAARLLHERPGGISQIAFPHPLVHAAVYQDLGPARRAALHARAASLAEDERSRLRHRTRAAIAPDPELTADLARLGRHQMLMGAWERSGEFLASAARLTPDAALREQLTLEAVECQLLIGDISDPDALITRLRLFHAKSWRNYVLARLAVVGGRMHESRALLHAAWQDCHPETESVLAARIAGQLAMLSVFGDHGQDAVSWSDLALRLAPEQTATDFVRAMRSIGLGMIGKGEATLGSLRGLPEPAVAAVAELDSLLGRAWLRAWTDDLQGSHQDLVGLLHAAHGRSVPFRLLASAILGEVEYRLGRWEDALVHLELGISIAVDAQQTWLAPLCHAVAALIPAARGQWNQASACVTAARTSTPHPGNVVAVAYTASAEAHLATAQGDPEQVIVALQPLAAGPAASAAFEPGIMRWQDLLVDALVAVGKLEQAEAVLRQFELCAAIRQRHSTLAAAARARGTLAAARRDSTNATAAFQAGLDHLEWVDMRLDRALVELAYGSFLRRAGRRKAAATHLEAAHAILQRLGARPYLERCEQELVACGRMPGHPPTPDRARLTAQELAAAQLVGQGLTNRQIARELVVSVKTVEYHLGHVYDKLGIRSRTQLIQRLSLGSR